MTREEIEKLPFNIDMLLSESLLVDTKEQVHKKITEVCSLAIKALEQELRDCKTCIHSDKGKCAGTEECHECMWESKYEQQPCEDCISREYILSKAHCCCDDLADDEPCCVDVDDIKEAPSIQPKPKTGHWIMSDDGLYRPICNNCGAHPWKGYIPTVEEATEVFKYCPNCGAKMESEVPT